TVPLTRVASLIVGKLGSDSAVQQFQTEAIESGQVQRIPALGWNWRWLTRSTRTLGSRSYWLRSSHRGPWLAIAVPLLGAGGDLRRGQRHEPGVAFGVVTGLCRLSAPGMDPCRNDRHLTKA